jgi:hypothetical protein
MDVSTLSQANGLSSLIMHTYVIPPLTAHEYRY